VNEFIEDSFGNMTQGQREMVSTVLGTHDQFIVVQGDAGTGKTYAGAAIKQYMSEHHAFIDVVGLAFTGKAAQTLEEEGGITSSTLHRFLYQEKKGKSDASTQRLILVDEARMAGSMQIAELMKVARQNGDKVVFIGDDKQFSSIAAGNIFIDMQKFGATTVHMSETMRQNSEHAKGIVMAVKNRQAERAINMLKKRGSFMENDREVSIEMIAQRYSEKYAFIDPLKDELIIASRNRDRIQINDRIRTHLGKHGTGEHHIVKEVVLQNGVGRYFTNQLEEGMVIIPSKIPNSKNGAEYQISTILDEKHIEIESSSGARTVIDFYHYSQQCQIYRKVEKEFSIGETIIFTKNTVIEDGKKVKNGERAVIENIGNGMIQTTDGKRIDIKTMNYVDHGYAITDFKSQGVTTKNITILADAQTASMNAFYTQVTRAKEDITIYTDNQEALLANLNKDVKMCSTLDYTTGGREIKKSVLTKQEIAQTFRGCGSTLSGVTFRLEKSLKKLNVSDSDSYSKNIRKYLIGAINKVVEKLDMVAQKLSKKPKKISSTLSLKHNRTKGERRVVKIKL
jgi:ATP-dependent exoDNAse (exonuclease V) alpha subunit